MHVECRTTTLASTPCGYSVVHTSIDAARFGVQATPFVFVPALVVHNLVDWDS